MPFSKFTAGDKVDGGATKGVGAVALLDDVFPLPTFDSDVLCRLTSLITLKKIPISKRPKRPKKTAINLDCRLRFEYHCIMDIVSV